MIGNDVVYERVVYQLLRRQAARYKNREFLRFNEQAFGYEDCDVASDRVAKGLQDIGLVKGDKVGIIMGNRPEFLFPWFRLSKLGAVEVPLNTAHRGDLLTYMLMQADCRCVVVEPVFLDRLAPVLKNLPLLEKVVVLTEQGQAPPRLDKPAVSYAEIIANDGK